MAILDFEFNTDRKQKSTVASHQDYVKNVDWYKRYFINREDPNGVRFMINSSEGRKNNLASVSYKNPDGPDFLNFMYLHQDHESFKREVELVYKKYLKLSEKYVRTNS